MSSHLIDQFPPPIIFGHRGASNYAPENTLAAFQLAFEQGAKAIELDVMLSKDEEVMVIHDHTVERTTNGVGSVAEMEYGQLKKLDAGIHFPKYKGEKIPTLKEVFDLVQGKYLVNIELKNLHSVRDSLVEKVVELVIKHKMEESVLFSSFLPTNIRKVRRMSPHIPAGLLVSDGIAGKLEQASLFRWLSPEFIHPHFSQVNERYVKNEHRHKRRVNVWTVNEKPDIMRMIEYQVDGIITNDPVLALSVKEESRQ